VVAPIDFPRMGKPVLIIANPLYDSVFKALLEDLETARGFLSILIEMKVIQVHLLAQEYAHRDPRSGDLKVFRLDFCATVETSSGRRYQVLIELQKANLGRNTLRFRHYLGSRYQSVEEVVVDEIAQKVSLPIISIYLLGYILDEALPMATRVRRRYLDAVTGEELAEVTPPEFIEQLTHEALFVQIPKIGAKRGSRLEQVLAVFDQSQKLEGDAHRLAVQEDLAQTDPVLERMLRKLNRLQESPEMEQIMSLEDLYQLEQEQLSLELEAARRALRKEQSCREEQDARLKEQAGRLEEKQRRLEEEQRRLEEEQRRLEEEQRRREEEQRRREAAEQEIELLRKLLKDREQS